MGPLDKGYEKAMALMSKPFLYRQEDSPMLATLELLERVKEIYRLGYEDGTRQGEANSVIEKLKDDARH